MMCLARFVDAHAAPPPQSSFAMYPVVADDREAGTEADDREVDIEVKISDLKELVERVGKDVWSNVKTEAAGREAGTEVKALELKGVAEKVGKEVSSQTK